MPRKVKALPMNLIYQTGISTPLASFPLLRRARCPVSYRTIMSSSLISDSEKQNKLVWIWTECKEVMIASVERGWNTFIFPSESRFRDLASEWSSIALIHPLFIEGSEISNMQNQVVARLFDVCSPEDLLFIQPHEQTNDLVINFKGEWQVIPAENLVAAFQGCKRTVLAVTTNSSEAQVFLEALEQGLGGVVLKVDDIGEVFALNSYFDQQNEVRNLLSLTRATVTHVQVVGMGDRVCIDLCSLMRPGEGLLVGSFARGLFLVHSECLESNYIASRPFRVNAGPVHAYVSIPGGKTCYLSELQAGKEVVVVDRNGKQRNAIVGRVKIESRPLILVEVKENMSNEMYSILLQNAETVGLVCPCEDKSTKTVIPVTSLKVGDEVLVRVQGAARHTGIEIQEFIIER
ncbi:3-dehydroquinate synthase homolog isoform X2 [Dioscorea cayenensis subsp. rotundata]|uniref:3-dehydroquinate synthase homolog isoform X2 n=1 Tax=Dioscorea cayennensis subsp. rotundata TaxID=55577 RepID=A0AB40BE61_DIOCR|nr:3-dehydroquinate synthase homolog isoform X2 [Dioscorea cayenensis subsp. rotundata]